MKLSKLHLNCRLTVIILAVITTVQITRAQEIYRLESTPASVQLRTNGLYYLVANPNIGVEIQTDLGLAFQLDYVGAWWNNNSKHRYFSDYGFQTELRYYLAAPQMETPYNGHHFGVYFQMATYDFEFGGKGYQCKDLDKSIGFGLSYGYSMPLSRHFNIDFTVGIGYFTSKYTEYEPTKDWYQPIGYKKLNWFGPTKLEVSLVWNLNRKNDK